MTAALDLLKSEFSTLSGIAEAAGAKSFQVVQQWKDKVPAHRVLTLCKASDWRITPHQLRPDLYPNADDALPASMKAPA